MTSPTLDRWTEDQGKLALWYRVGADPHAGIPGRCEGCGQARPLDPSHRIPRSQGGTWTPTNLVALCRPCHTWLHANQHLAHGLGWELPAIADPAAEAAWIITAHLDRPAWHLLGVEHDTDGIRRHVVRLVTPRWAA